MLTGQQLCTHVTTPTLPWRLPAGGEVRLPAGSAVTHAVLACQGASLGGNPTEALTAGLLQHVLGSCSFVKWGETASRLGKAVSAATKGPFAVSCGWGGRGALDAAICMCAVSAVGGCSHW